MTDPYRCHRCKVYFAPGSENLQRTGSGWLCGNAGACNVRVARWERLGRLTAPAEPLRMFVAAP